jgi:multisubunit Na+/H+ antiporter MnhB subunit
VGAGGRRRNIATVERAYRHSTRAVALAICLLGVAMTLTALARGGGPLALGVVVGVAFTLLGAGRLYLATRPDPRRDAR